MAFIRKAKRYFRKQAKRAYGAAKKRYLAPGGAGRMARDIAMLKTALNVEKKYWDRTELVTADLRWSTGAYVQSPWDGLGPGTGPSGRNGDQIKALLTSWRVMLSLIPNTITPANSVFVRFLVVMDMEPRISGVLDGVTLQTALLQYGADNGAQTILSPYRVTQISGLAEGFVGQRFKILRDFKVKLDNLTQKEKVLTISIDHTKSKYKGQRVKYGNIAADDGKPIDNRLYLVAVTDNDVASTVSIMSNSRVKFVDN